MKKEFKVIADLLPNNTRVLDVGCGDGSLMNLLVKEKNIEVRGLELEKHNVQECIYKGLPVIQGNAETELYQFPNQSFDYVVLSQTLQAFYSPDKVLKELLPFLCFEILLLGKLLDLRALLELFRFLKKSLLPET